MRSGPQGTVEEWEIEVTDYEPNQILGISSRRGQLLWDEVHVFVREEGATRYTFAMEVTGSTLPGATIQKQMVETALQLKWALESPLLRAY